MTLLEQIFAILKQSRQLFLLTVSDNSRILGQNRGLLLSSETHRENVWDGGTYFC